MSNIPPGSYLQTSRNVEVKSTDDGRIIIVAECQKIDGSWVQSELKYDIANCNGVLKFAPNGC